MIFFNPGNSCGFHCSGNCTISQPKKTCVADALFLGSAELLVSTDCRKLQEWSEQCNHIAYGF